MLKKNFVLPIIIVLAPLIFGAIFLKFGPSFPMPADSQAYHELGQNIIAGQGFTIEGEPLHVAPIYPFFLSFIYLFFGPNLKAVYFCQFIILAGLALLIYRLANKFLKMPLWLAFLLALTTAFWPYFLLFANLPMTEMLFSFLLALAFYFFLKFYQRPAWSSGLTCGLIFGLASLTRPVILLLPLWLLIGLVVFFKQFRRKKMLYKMAFVLLGFILVISPWIIRDYLTFNKFIPIHGGLGGLIRKSYQQFDYTPNAPVIEEGQVSLKMILLARVKNIFLFWNPGAQGSRAEFLIEKYPLVRWLFNLYRIGFIALLVLAFFSLKFIFLKKYRYQPASRMAFLLCLNIGYFWAVHTVFYPYPRYTLPIIPLTLCLSFMTLGYFAYRLANKNLPFISQPK